jgi:hypothetical protein
MSTSYSYRSARTLGAVLLIWLCGCHRESQWEKSLLGPFYGDAFSGQLISQSASSVTLPKNLVLDVHWETITNAPIICLREQSGTCIWARVLIPRFGGQQEPRGRITALTLNNVKAVNDGFKVMLSCDWTGGGKEGGIIYLNTNYTFRSFALGW